MPVCSRSVRHAIREEYRQLGVDHAPVLPSASPFFRDIHHSKVQHFQQLSSVGNTDFALVTFRSWRLKPSIAFVVLSRYRLSTTNAIESLNSTCRKLNRQRSVFPSDKALLKALYLATFETTKKWTMSIQNWGKSTESYLFCTIDE